MVALTIKQIKEKLKKYDIIAGLTGKNKAELLKILENEMVKRGDTLQTSDTNCNVNSPKAQDSKYICNEKSGMYVLKTGESGKKILLSKLRGAQTNTPGTKRRIKFKEPIIKTDLDDLQVPELKEYLKQRGIKAVLPKLKPDLLVFAKADRCDPTHNSFCKEDEVCDLRNNICLPANLVKGKVKTINIGGKRVAGKDNDLKNISAILEEKVEEKVSDEKEKISKKVESNRRNNITSKKNFVNETDLDKILKNVFKDEKLELKTLNESIIDKGITELLNL